MAVITPVIPTTSKCAWQNTKAANTADTLRRARWSQDCTTREEALAAEQQIKGWSRKKKEAMMRGDWKTVQQIAWGTNNPLPEKLR